MTYPTDYECGRCGTPLSAHYPGGLCIRCKAGHAARENASRQEMEEIKEQNRVFREWHEGRAGSMDDPWRRKLEDEA